MNDNIVQLMNIMSKIDIENKFKVLRGIKNNPNSSQRKLAEELGFSLGKLNYCLNALKQKGFIKIQNFLSLAVTNQGEIIAINSSGDLFKVNASNGDIYWSLNTTESLLAHASDFFYSSEIVTVDEEVLFSTGSSFYSYNIRDGYLNWEQEVNSIGAPIVDGKNIFIVTNNGYFVIINRITGKIISSNNILRILKKKETKY